MKYAYICIAILLNSDLTKKKYKEDYKFFFVLISILLNKNKKKSF